MQLKTQLALVEMDVFQSIRICWFSISEMKLDFSVSDES